MASFSSQPTDQTLEKVSPDEIGFAPDIERKLAAGIESGLLRHLHEVLAGRSGKLGIERYYDGPDNNWGQFLGHVTFEPDTLHDLRSITKSVISLLYGIALDRGLVPSPDAPLLAQFPEYPDLAADPDRAKLKIKHALTMTLGMEWDEDKPYSDPENSEIAMELSKDRYRFVLDRPIICPPGERWIYSGGSVALLGALLARGTGKSLPDFAREALFEPLGITQFEWSAGSDGVPSAASGLRLTGRDLFRIGTLALNKGVWGGRRIVSSSWLDDSFKSHIPTGDGLFYGYLWFIGEAPTPAGDRRWIAGFGNGGQRLFLMPGTDLVSVIFSGRYNTWDNWITPMRIWREIVLANLVEV
ncbi:serine hydrolase [Phyllobacterium sp. SB3]|uniref:serine hydrolase domain-containing protein n=1 Tax=Phyllobacterium sp. SB3 TaxID=3156073 RepID=UPI0032AEB0A4